MAEDENVVIEGLGKGKINFGQVIMFHLDRSLKACASPLGLDDVAKDTFYNAVRGLDAVLSIYRDKEYESDKLKIMAKSEPRDSISSVDEYYEWLGLLIKQVRKAGLLPAEEVKIMDDYDEQESDIIVA